MIGRIAFIQAGQKAGITLAEIKQSLDRLLKNRTSNKADWEIISAESAKILNNRITQLETLRNTMTSCVLCGFCR